MLKYIYIIILLTFSLCGCDILSPKKDYEYTVIEKKDYEYTVIEIANQNIKDAMKAFPGYEHFDIPLEIKLEDYKMNSDEYKGKAKLAKLGWVSIVDSKYSDNILINTENLLGPVHTISIEIEIINAYYLKGKFGYFGPTLDHAGCVFNIKAVKKKNLKIRRK